jgi:hypothetical protein
MYAKNRIQCASAKVTEPNVCEKLNIMCYREGNQPNVSRCAEPLGAYSAVWRAEQSTVTMCTLVDLLTFVKYNKCTKQLDDK